MTADESQLEYELRGKLRGLKYDHRTNLRDLAALEKNFRERFKALNHVKLTDAEFDRLLTEIVTGDVFTAARTLHHRNSFTRTILCFVQLFVVSNHDSSYNFANNNASRLDAYGHTTMIRQRVTCHRLRRWTHD